MEVQSPRMGHALAGPWCQHKWHLLSLAGPAVETRPPLGPLLPHLPSTLSTLHQGAAVWHCE